MKTNIFKNVHFSKLYKTRDGRKAIYLGSFYNDKHFPHKIAVDGCGTYGYPDDGTYIKERDYLDIISEWHEPIVCKCQWKDYYDYRIMFPDGEGHVRVSFFTDEIIISDLYVSEEYRHKGYAIILLDKVDELLAGRKAIIYPLEEWQREWYEQRGYIIGKEDSVDEEELDELADRYASAIAECEQHGEYIDDADIFKAGFLARGCYCKGKD